MKDDKKEIAKLLVKTGSYVNANTTNEKQIKTPNGDIVPAYLSCRLIISDVNARELLEEQLVQKVSKEFKDNNLTIVGMATAGITWAHAIANKLKLPLLYIRSKEKEYGLKGLIEGNIKNATKNAIIVDDVLYTGNTINSAKKVLEETGINTVGVVCIATLRYNIVKELTEKNVKVLNLTNYTQLIDVALESGVLNQEEYYIMKNIYEEKEEEIRK